VACPAERGRNHLSVREEIIHLVKQFPESDVAAVKRMLHGLHLVAEAEEDPLRASLGSCPEDDEPSTEEDLAALAGGRDELAQ
jgi:hypothetical protein